MKTLDEIVAEATAARARLSVNTEALSRLSDTPGEGLFHVPLLALTILVVSRARKGLPTTDVATWTLATLVKHFEALRLARWRIQWSFVLRQRCADALVFLEATGLTSVVGEASREVRPSVNGREFIVRLSRQKDEIGVLVRKLERAHRAVDQTGLELL